MQYGKSIRGWQRVSHEDQDPDSTRRPAVLRSRNEELDRHLAVIRPGEGPLSESVSPLFQTPPDVCTAARKTILYGVIPLASSERSETAPVIPAYKASDVASLLPPHLKAGLAASIPLPATTLSAGDARNPALADFVRLLRQLAVEFDLFGSSATSKALFAEVNRITCRPERRRCMRPIS